LEPRTQTFKIMSALAAFIRELLDLMEAQP